MSFAEELCVELCDLPIKKPCCRRALTAGLLISAEIGAQKTLAVRYRRESVATLASAMIHAQYGKSPESEMTGKSGHRYYDFSFVSSAAVKLVSQLQMPDADADKLLHVRQCEGCAAAFLRGAFLAVGTMNDPEKAFHLEFSLGDGRGEAVLRTVMTLLECEPRRVVRASGVGLYIKQRDKIELLLARVGSQSMLFEYIDKLIKRDIRNRENRVTNCETKNIEKAIAAAQKQMDAINFLMEQQKFDRLPEPLRVSAMVRYQNPDATLDELVLLHDPPISKSGLNHRLAKLVAAADEWKGGSV